MNVESLCWSCRHAYADGCFSVSVEDRVWIQKIELLERKDKSKKSPVVIRKVLKCARYEAGRKEAG